MSKPNLIYVDPREVTVLVHRGRDEQQFALVKENIRKIGVQQPIQVRDITNWKPDRRRRPDGGLYKWLANFGEGRCRACLELFEETGDKFYLRVPAEQVEELTDGEIAARFLSENLIRRDLSWQEQARLIKRDVDSGLSPEQIAQGYSITIPHLEKLLRLLNRISPSLAKELNNLNLREAEMLSSLPSNEQEIVIETMRDEGLREDQLPAVVRKAREVMDESGEKLSKKALQDSLQRVREDLQRVRQSLKKTQLHHLLGPENLKTLLKDRKFRNALDVEGVNYAKFLEAVK